MFSADGFREQLVCAGKTVRFPLSVSVPDLSRVAVVEFCSCLPPAPVVRADAAAGIPDNLIPFPVPYRARRG